ncbi:hypothetical protein B4U80_13689 [Leptotrombidium deliense]|uniref:Uncharacterized protein n=1 Tax=Leptotrombidium deliense TaxID=299467 RepID=A0A443SKU6_9ACAR|nr:hypothetical protein B4U80_13689 [Leptotrombidium deliense]
MLLCPFSVIYIPPINEEEETESENQSVQTTTQVSFKQILSITNIQVICLVVFTELATLASLTTILELLLLSIKCTRIFIGFAFSVIPLFYSLMSLLVDKITQRITPKYVLLLGLLLNVISFAILIWEKLIAAYFNIEYLIIPILALIGTGQSLSLIPSMPLITQSVTELGWSANTNVYSKFDQQFQQISCSFVIGSLMSGYIYEHFEAQILFTTLCSTSQ